MYHLRMMDSPQSLCKDAYNFKYSKVIGDGKFGTTYKGADKENTAVAVKHFTSDISSDTHGIIDHVRTFCTQRINKEGKTQHPNLLRYIDYDFVDDEGSGNHYIIAEYCNKGNLAQYIESNPNVQLAEKLHLMLQCAEGLHALHSMTPPIVHGYIKPQNILLTEIGGKLVLKLGDYYSSVILQTDNQYSAYSDTHASGGHNWNDEAFYKAPEAFPLAGSVVKKSISYDVFSLGCVFYGLLEKDWSSQKLCPYVKGKRRDPIGYILGRLPTTELFEHTASCPDVKQIEIIIKEMLALHVEDRPKASEIVTRLKHVKDRSAQFGPKPVDNKAAGIFRKFYKILETNGPLEATDKRIIEPFSKLGQEEIQMVMAKGSIPNFLLSPCFDGIDIKEDNKLCLVGNQEPQMRNSETYNPENRSQTDSGAICTPKSNNSTKDNNSTEDIIEETYQKFLEQLKNDKEVGSLVETYRSSKDETIYVSLDKTDESFVKNHMEKNYPQYKFEYFQDDDGFEWLMMNESDDVFIDKTIGPGSFFMVDNDLKFLKDYGANKMICNVKDFVFNNTSWGTLGCFAEHPSKGNLYAVSVKHIINKIFGSHNDQNIQMISGFEQNHKITVKDHLQRNESLSVQAKDFVYVSKGYTGILDLKKEKLVDIALYGPLTRSMEKNHDLTKNNKHRVQIIPCQNIVGREVMKYGAKTGFTRGIVLVVDHKARMKSDNDIRLGKGTFVVTSQDDDQQPDEDGKFAKEGDSGSIVLLDDEHILKGIGIVFQLKRLFKYTNPRTNTTSVLKNVTFCICLDHAIAMLEESLRWRPQLYYYHFQPRLCLGEQNDDDGIVNEAPTVLCATSVTSKKNDDDPLCSGSKYTKTNGN